MTKDLPQDIKNESGISTGKNSLGRLLFGLSSIAIFTKIFGFGEKLVIAHFFGTGDTADVYFASIGVIFSFVFLVKELVYPSLLPVFAARQKKIIRIRFQLWNG